MAKREIKCFSKKNGKHFVDKIGALEKGIKMKRMEPYADVIAEVLAKYNQDDDLRTMMFKLLREPVEGTTTRKKHTENVAYIAETIAKKFKWLNPGLTRVMAKEHDTGHTFLGHSGEWWLSKVKDKFAIGVYVHNALGARKLVYRHDIFSDIEKAILEKEPNINPRKLAAIKRDLWLIIDGINCHNGEKSEYSYAPDFSKTKNRFFDEIMGCFVKQGYDKKLEPATAEGSLMRLCDKISYIPFDLVDIFRNGCNIETLTTKDGKTHNFYEEYQAKFTELNKIAKRTRLEIPPISVERLLACRTQEEYDAFALDMQQIFITDVIKNTRRNNIRMSPEMSKIMHGIRDINNSMMVNYVVLKEDHETYPAAMEELMRRYAKVLIGNGIVAKNPEESEIKNFEKNPALVKEFVSTYESVSYGKKFAEFITQTPASDFQFTVEMIKKAFEETTDNELDIAKAIVTGKISEDSIEAQDDKKQRIFAYADAFRQSMRVACDNGYIDNESNSMINNFKRNIWLSKSKERLKSDILLGNPTNPITGVTKTLQERVSLELAAQFLASLNDEEWKQLLIDSKIVDESQIESLTRKYSSFDFRAEAKPHGAWIKIANNQRKSTERHQKKDFISIAKKFLGFSREDD